MRPQEVAILQECVTKCGFKTLLVHKVDTHGIISKKGSKESSVNLIEPW